MQHGAALRFRDGSFGQLLEIVDDSTLSVSRMTKDPKNVCQLLLGDAREFAARDSVAAFENITKLADLAAHQRAWRKVGLRLIKTSCIEPDVFARSDEQGVVLLGNVDSDDDDDDAATTSKRKRSTGMCGYVSDDGFVVADGEPFTLADPQEDSGFVAEVHDAVHAYEDWAPAAGTKEAKFRSWMQRFEQKVAHDDDNRQFARGTNVNYARPPKRAKGKPPPPDHQ